MKENKPILLDIIESAIANVQINEQKINDLNVFPVPDGDTGSNMLATLLSAWNYISPELTKDLDIVQAFAKGALFGARGNSGVITSQIIKGFAVGVEKIGKIEQTHETLRTILRNMREYAYKAVPSPVEGTILSVVKALDTEYDRSTTSLTSAVDSILKIAKKATEHTPEQLPILKEAGVVDSGAYGLVCLLEGIKAALAGNPFKIKTTTQGTQSHTVDKFVKANAHKNIGYCSEFIMTLKDEKSFDDKEFKKWLSSIGDSLVFIREEDILKVHLHTKNPEQLLEGAHKYGEFSKIKIENMTTQVEGEGHEIIEGHVHHKKKGNEKELGIIAVSNGTGLDEDFLNLNVDHIVSGGQTMNPSVQDFSKLIANMPNKEILLLPNNPNIVLTVQTVAKLLSKDDKKIHTLDTKSLQQGLVALYNISKEMLHFEKYKADVETAYKSIKEGSVTKSIRNTNLNGVEVKKGDFISLSGKKIVCSERKITSAIEKLVSSVLEKDTFRLTIYYNDDVSSDLLDTLKAFVEKNYPDVELNLRYGGQAVYYFLVFAEKE